MKLFAVSRVCLIFQRYTSTAQNKIHLSIEHWADFVASSILSQTNASPDVIFEYQPGPGLLTKAFLKHSVCTQWLYEGRNIFKQNVQEFCKTHHAKCKVFPFHPYYPHTAGKSDDSMKEILLGRTAPTPWIKESQVVVVSVASTALLDRVLIPGLVQSLVEHTGFFSCGRVPHYLLLSGFEYLVMTNPTTVFTHCSRNPCWRAFLYHTFFDVTFISKVRQQIRPRKRTNALRWCSDSERTSRLIHHLVPSEAINCKLTTAHKKLDYDRDFLYLVKLIPKENLQEFFPDCHALSDLIFSAKHLLKYRGQRIIPLLERWLPGIGIDLIMKGYTMSDHLKDLDFCQYPEIFKVLFSHPDYSKSSFKLLLTVSNPVRVNIRELSVVEEA